MPKIILISVDTLRADRLGSYGYPGKFTPAMDELASQGVRFANCRSAAPWTLPSHASVFTGLYPTDHRAVDDKVRIRDDAAMLTEHLKKAGYKTAAFISHYYVGGQYGFKRGFDEFTENEESTADVVADQAVRWLKKNSDKSFFLFLHFFDPHTPYQPPPSVRVRHLAPEAEYVRGDTADVLHVVNNESDANTPALLSGLKELYDGEIEYTDQMIGRVMAAAKKLQLKNTMVVLMSDHGEEFMEHRLMEHGFTLYEEQLHVPLIVWWPEKLKAGKTVDAPTSLLDLFPTFLDLTKLPAVQGLPGMSLVPLMNDTDSSAVGAFKARTLLAETTRQGPDRMCVIRDGMKYIYAPDFRLDSRLFGQELFNLAADPLEKKNLLVQEPQLGRDMLKRLFDTGFYQKRRQFSLLFASPRAEDKFLGDIRTNGSFISAYKDNVRYGTDQNRQLVSLEFGLKKEEQKLHFLALAGDGDNGVHFFQEPENSAMMMDLLVNEKRDPKSVQVGAKGTNPPDMPFLVPADAAGARALPKGSGFMLWCEETLVNKHVLTRFEVGDQIDMSPEMIAKLKSLGYVSDGAVVKKKEGVLPALNQEGSPPEADTLLKDQKIDYQCRPLEF